MCRWAAYLGEPIYLEDIITAPEQSLLRQSLHAQESKTETNGDGFGIAWYGDRPIPGVYRDILPAWSDPNLSSIAHQVRAGCFLAHVRASTGTATSRSNCHPFTVGRWSFMHNGQIGGFPDFRRNADMLIDSRHYAYRNGTTDSEALFLMACSNGLSDDPKRALERATGQMEEMSRASGSAPHIRMTVAMSDGETLFAARYATDQHAPSLYISKDDTGPGRAIVSEPLGSDGRGWSEVPAGFFVTVTNGDVDISPFCPSS
ncbi:MAG: class II glutamine amidotransferase [Pseudomonadota bacterium]